ncbi:MAG TPA: response regulator [Bryobacteraceae bacterium]|jgi:two-component system, cell cycle response regulator DivK|nr:response regulator [Bryobacteraceae bacterium]
MKTVLIADDKATGRELVRTVLEKDGFIVIEASDGVEAVRTAKENSPDLIILDLHMPGLDGFAVIQELRRDQRFVSTPIMALTASAMQGDRERALAVGFTGYVTKPIRLGALRGEVERLLK